MIFFIHLPNLIQTLVNILKTRKVWLPSVVVSNSSVRKSLDPGNDLFQRGNVRFDHIRRNVIPRISTKLIKVPMSEFLWR